MLFISKLRKVIKLEGSRHEAVLPSLDICLQAEIKQETAQHGGTVSASLLLIVAEVL